MCCKNSIESESAAFGKLKKHCRAVRELCGVDVYFQNAVFRGDGQFFQPFARQRKRVEVELFGVRNFKLRRKAADPQANWLFAAASEGAFFLR